MIVNSAKEYRQWVKFQEDRPDVMEDFIGCCYENNGQKVKGFFNLFHGLKPDIEKYLPSLLDIAEDNQAIYEFLQNAVDCGATHFWAFYNDQYFLAVNNGEKFSIEGVSSILNIAQSTKYTASSIGRLGIGFKLVHRLVGKGNGTHELVHGNKGPILFSWDKQEQMKALISSESISCEGLDDNPFLFKIAITNFPANVDEVVKDINYEDTIIFPTSELKELQSFASQCLSELYTDSPSSFNQGTLFFIKLGENKKRLLDEDLDTLKNGIEYSMNTLKQLDNITFNGETIYKKKLVINDNSIKTNTELFSTIDPQYKEFDILYSFGYLPFDFTSNEYYHTAEQLRQSPNFYKYFPMGDEVDNMALFIHSDSFQIEANRRKLINHHTNQKLLPEIAGFIVNTLNQYKINDRSKYLQLYASILLTDKPSSKEKGWMNEIFFNILFNAIKTSAPTIDGDETNLSNVKIKDVKVDIPLDKIGLSHIKWFYWHGDNHEEIIDAAYSSDKLDLYKWNINTIIEECDIKLLNEWLASCAVDMFDSFIDEIKSTTTSNRVKQLLPQIKLFKVGDDRKSRIEIVSDKDYLITTTKIEGIIPIIKKIGIKCTNETFENHKLVSLLSSQDEDTMFEIIKAKAEESENWAKLSSNDKLQLVTVLRELEDVWDVSIKRLKIFKNVLGNQCALENLASYKDIVDTWQKPYVICKEENFSEIQKYLLKSETAFSDTIEVHFGDIIENGATIDELYSAYAKNQIQWKDDLTIKMINAYGCTEEVLSLIEKSPSKTAVDEFIKKLETINLVSTSLYSPSSFEYRCIQIAAKVESVSIRNKIKIDETPLTSFTSSNELSFTCKNAQGKEFPYTMKLSDILPDDTQCALYGKVAEFFSSIIGYKKIFSADRSSNSIVQARLRALLTPENTIVLPAQFIFILFTRWQNNYPSLSNWDRIVRFGNTTAQIGTTLAGILDYAFQHNLTDVLVQYKSIYTWSQHGKGRYMFSTEYTLENERAYKEIEEWCGDNFQKKEILKKLDVHFDDGAEIKRRKQFKENTFSEWDGETFPSSFLAWVASFESIDGDNQKKLLFNLTNKFNNVYLKRVYTEEDYSDAKELDSTKYIAWKPSKSISILGLGEEMPVRIIYNKEKVIARLNVGPYKYFPDTKHLYINGVKEEEIASVLAQVYQDKNIPFDYQDYTAVCFDSYEEQRKKDEKIRMYEELINQLTESQIELPPSNKEVLEKGNVDRQAQAEFNKEARINAKKYLSNRGYDVSAWEPETSLPDIVDVIKDSTGNLINVVVRSAKQKMIHLSASSFEVLMSRPNNLLVVENDKGIHCVTFTELFGNNNNVNLLFDARHTPREYFQALGTIFKYVKGTEFVVRDPNYSTFDEIRGFGLDVKNDGAVLITDDLTNI
ncbi:MAG: hypothetical protein II849_00635 [Bacteroidales bacterium]|nr:hypothetical protein [Bacteroidales bacterium]